MTTVILAAALAWPAVVVVLAAAIQYDRARVARQRHTATRTDRSTP